MLKNLKNDCWGSISESLQDIFYNFSRNIQKLFHYKIEQLFFVICGKKANHFSRNICHRQFPAEFRIRIHLSFKNERLRAFQWKLNSSVNRLWRFVKTSSENSTVSKFLTPKLHRDMHKLWGSHEISNKNWMF